MYTHGIEIDIPVLQFDVGDSFRDVRADAYHDAEVASLLAPVLDRFHFAGLLGGVYGLALAPQRQRPAGPSLAFLNQHRRSPGC